MVSYKNIKKNRKSSFQDAYLPELMNRPLNIIFEDDFILVADKPAGLMVEPDRNQNPNLLDDVKHYLRSKGDNDIYAQHIHRLDRPVRGIVLFAIKREVLKNLSEQFAERKVKKFYQALTESTPQQKQGRLEHWHRKEKKKAILYADQIEYSEKAILDYAVEQIAEHKFLWDIQLHTGKYHQIRAQLASLDCAIIGDYIYGSNLPYNENAIALLASRLIFHHPVTNEVLDIQIQSSLT